MERINASQLKELLERKNRPLLVDVRTPSEFAQERVRGAINLPLDSLNLEELRTLAGEATEPVYFICRSGGRSAQACEAVEKDLGRSAVSVEGGTQAAAKAGIPILRGETTISIERQVRIAAGALVLVGTLGAIYLASSLIWLSVFVGAGLLFAGLTDSCGMAKLLMIMPWNKKSLGAPGGR